MSVVKKIKKAVKSGLRSSAAMVTGGASELYKGYKDLNQDVQSAEKDLSNYKQDVAQQNMEAFGYSNIGDLVAAQKRKNAELEERRKVTGISSLLGGNIGLG